MKIVLLKIVNAAILYKTLSDMTIELLIFYKIYQRSNLFNFEMDFIF